MMLTKLHSLLNPNNAFRKNKHLDIVITLTYIIFYVIVPPSGHEELK